MTPDTQTPSTTPVRPAKKAAKKVAKKVTKTVTDKKSFVHPVENLFSAENTTAERVLGIDPEFPWDSFPVPNRSWEKLTEGTPPIKANLARLKGISLEDFRHLPDRTPVGEYISQKYETKCRFRTSTLSIPSDFSARLLSEEMTKVLLRKYESPELWWLRRKDPKKHMLRSMKHQWAAEQNVASAAAGFEKSYSIDGPLDNVVGLPGFVDTFNFRFMVNPHIWNDTHFLIFQVMPFICYESQFPDRGSIIAQMESHLIMSSLLGMSTQHKNNKETETYKKLFSLFHLRGVRVIPVVLPVTDLVIKDQLLAGALAPALVSEDSVSLYARHTFAHIGSVSSAAVPDADILDPTFWWDLAYAWWGSLQAGKLYVNTFSRLHKARQDESYPILTSNLLERFKNGLRTHIAATNQTDGYILRQIGEAPNQSIYFV